MFPTSTPGAVVETFPPASFGGTPFPWTERTITWSMDHVVHKYIHRPGGKVEVLSRHLMEFRFKCPFHTTVPGLEDDYRVVLSELITMGDAGLTADLEVPGLGTVKAKLIHYTDNLRAAITSGTSIELVFLENTDTQFTTPNLIGAASSSMPTQFAVFTTAIGGLDQPPPLFVLIRVNDLAGALDNLMAGISAALADVAAISMLVGIFIAIATEIDGYAFFQELLNVDAWLALQDLMWSGIELSGDALAHHSHLAAYVTPDTMTIMQVSMAVYEGDSSRGLELLQLNDIQDALHIPPMTLVKHYTE